MRGIMAVYIAGFECADGARLSCKFKSDHVIVGNRININTNPLLSDAIRAINKKSSNPKTKTYMHGGAKKLKMIRNADTGTSQLYDLYV